MGLGAGTNGAAKPSRVLGVAAEPLPQSVRSFSMLYRQTRRKSSIQAITIAALPIIV
jgi:hypothetical protein